MSASSTVTQIVFVNPDVQDFREILTKIGPDARVVVLDPSRDGLEQVKEVLREYEGVRAIHFVSHGDDGQVQIGGTLLTDQILEERAAEVAEWRSSLAEDADILLWACNVAADIAGQTLIRHIALLTGADVAASTNPTGSQALGGDVILEASTGPIDPAASSLLNEKGFTQLLTTVDIIINEPIGDGNLDETEDNNVTITGTTKRIEPNQVVTLTIFDTDGITPAVTATTTVGADGKWTVTGLNLSGLGDGTLIVRAEVTNKAGRTVIDFARVGHDTTDSSDPAILIKEPIGDGDLNGTEDDNVTVSGSTTNVENGQLVTVTIDDADPTTPAVTKTAVVVVPPGSGTTGAWTVTGLNLSGLKDGTLTVRAEVINQAGKKASDDATVLHHAEPTKPEILIKQPIGDGNLDGTEDDNVTVSGSTKNVEDGQVVTIIVNDDRLQDPNAITPPVIGTAVVNGNSWSVSGLNLSGLKDGTLTVRAEVTDKANQKASDEATVKHSGDSDPNTPKILIQEPIGDGDLNGTEDDNVTVTGTTKNVEDGQVVTVVIDDFDDSTPAVTATVAVVVPGPGTDGTWTVTGLNLSGLKSGDLLVTATVITKGGITVADDAKVLHHPDVVDDKPQIQITTPIGDGDLDGTEDDSVTVTGTTKKVENGQLVTITIDDADPATPAVTATVAVVVPPGAGTDGTWTVTGLNLSGLKDGELTVQAEVINKAGQKASDDATVQHSAGVGPINPEIDITVPIGGDGVFSAAEDDNASVTGTTKNVENGQLVTITIDDADPTTPAVTKTAAVVVPGPGTDGTWTVTGLDLSGLDAGTLTVRAEVTNLAGTKATDQATVEHNLDDNSATIFIQTPIGDGALSASEDDVVLIKGNTSAEEGQTVTLTVTDPAGKTVTATTLVKPDGTWSFDALDLSGLGEGTLSVKAEVTDKEGRPAIDNVRVEHDTIPPQIAITSDSNLDNPTPVISGTTDAETGQKVTVTIDPDNNPATPNNVTYTAIVTADGTWRVDTKADTPLIGSLPPDGLTGPVGVKADVTDVAGNPAIPAKQTLTVDPNGPTITVDPLTDTALSATDDDAVTISGTTDAEPNSVVTVTIDDKDPSTPPVTATATVGTDGTWKVEGLDLSPLKDGTLSIKADVTNQAGLSGSDSVAVDHDTVPPEITIKSPAVLNNPAPVIFGTTDAEPGQTVTVVIDPDNDPATDNSVTYQTKVRPDQSWSIDTDANGDTPTAGTFPAGGLNGPAKVTATVSDVAGNPSVPAVKELDIDVDGPVIQINKVGDGELAAGEDRAVTVTGKTERVEPDQVVTVTISDGTKSQTGTGKVAADGTWSVTGLDLAELADGQLTVTADVTNKAGVPATDQATVLHDTLVPNIIIEEPIGDGALSALEDDAVTIRGTTTAEPNQVVTVTVADEAGKEVTGSTTVDAVRGWTLSGVDLSGLADGKLTVTAEVSDSAGNPTQDTAHVIHDTVPPNITITTPDQLGNPKPIINGTTDAEPGQTVTVVIDPDNDPKTPNDVTYETKVQPDGTWKIDTKNDTPVDGSFPKDGLTGDTKVTATVNDVAGNPSIPAEKVIAFPPDQPPVRISIDPLSDPALSATDDDTVTISGTTNAEPNSVVTVTIDDQDPATPPITASAVVDSDGNWRVDGLNLSPLKDGTLTIQADVTNQAGQKGSDSIEAVHDTVPPVISITSPDELNNPAPEIFGTTDAEPGQTVTVVIDPDNDPATDNSVTYETKVRPDQSWSIDTVRDTPAVGTFPADGLNGPAKVTATVSDVAGNPSIPAEKVIDVTGGNGLTIKIDRPIGDGELSAGLEDQAVTVSGITSAEVGQKVTITVDDTGNDVTTPVTGVATVTDGGKWVVTGLDLSTLDDGRLIVKADVTNLAGQSATDQATVGHDTVAPQIVIDEPIGDGALSAIEDDGVPISGNTTADENQTVFVLVSDGVKSVSGTAIVGADGRWTTSALDLSPLKDGKLKVTASVTDLAGNRTEDQADVLHDTVPPTITITTPGQLSNPKPVITGTTDAEPGQLVKVTIDPDNDPLTDNSVTYQTTVKPDQTWSLDTKTATPINGSLPADGLTGEVKVKAEVSDVAGNPAIPAEKIIEFPDVPGVTIAIDPLSDPALSATDDDAVTISGTTNAEPDSVVTVTIDDQDPSTPLITATATVGTDGTWKVDGLDLSPLKDGTLTILADVTNQAGQKGTDSTQALHDTVPPVITITSPDELSNPTPEIFGTTDAEPGQTVTVVIDPDNDPATDNSVTYEAKVRPDRSWSIDTANDTPVAGTFPADGLNGSAGVVATVSDVAGNPSVPATQTLTIDGTVVIKIDRPIGDGELSAGLEDQSVTVSGITSAEVGQKVTITVDDAGNDATAPVTGVATVTAGDTPAENKWSVTGLDLSALDDGRLIVKADVTNVAGQKATDEATVGHDTVAPQIVIDEPIGGDGVLSADEDDAVTISGSTTAGEGQTVLVTVTDGTDSVTATALVDGNQRWSTPALDLSGLATGTLEVTAVVADPAGNRASDDASVDKGEDNIAPSPTDRLQLDLQTTSDTDTNGAPNAREDNITADWTPTFDVVLPIDGSPNQASTGDVVKLFARDALGVEKEVASGTVSAADVTDKLITLTSTDLDDGDFTFTARLIGSAGNVKDSATLPVTIVTDGDGVNPSIESVPRAGDFNRDGTLDLLQSNVATYPMASPQAFAQKASAPVASFGSLQVGNVAPDGSGSVALEPAAQLSGIRVDSLATLGTELGVDLVTQAAEIPRDSVMSGVLGFSLAPKTGQASLADIDPSRDGVQTRVVFELPGGVTADTFYRIGATADDPTTHIYDFMADGDPATTDDGAELFDLDRNGTVDRVVVTYTGGAGGSLKEFGFLGMAEQCLDDGIANPGDVINGTRRPDDLTGTDRDDVIRGRRGRDTLHGSDGNDVLRGGRGKDDLDGGEGEDVIRGQRGGDTLRGGDCSDTLLGGWGADTLLGGGGDETLRGGRGADTVRGGTGQDLLIGNQGADNLYGDSGNDTLRGRYGFDKMYGGAGNDLMVGGKGQDTVSGGGGDDVVFGQRGYDRIDGNLGNDTLSGNIRRDFIHGGYGDDVILGGRGRDLLYGEQGNDTLIGGQAIFADRIEGGAGSDSMNGGRGRDSYVYASETLGQGDLTAGTNDSISDFSVRNFIDFSQAVENVLKIDGEALSALTGRVEVAGSIDARNSVAYNAATGIFQIDIDGNGAFDAAKDAQIQLEGVDRVLYGSARDRFVLFGPGYDNSNGVQAGDKAEPKNGGKAEDLTGSMFTDSGQSVDDLLQGLGVSPTPHAAPAVPQVADTSGAIQSLNQLAKLQDDQTGLVG